MEPEELRPNLAAFVEWRERHLEGDEKGEAQTFLDRLFKAFGHEGAIEAGAVYEDRIKRFDYFGVTYAALVWKPRFLVEMKKAGSDLVRHFRQDAPKISTPDSRLTAFESPCAHAGWSRERGGEQWGPMHERRVRLRSGLLVEFGLTTPDWAALPLDEGTAKVLADGCKIVVDDGTMTTALESISCPVADW